TCPLLVRAAQRGRAPRECKRHTGDGVAQPLAHSNYSNPVQAATIPCNGHAEEGIGQGSVKFAGGLEVADNPGAEARLGFRGRRAPRDESRAWTEKDPYFGGWQVPGIGAYSPQ